MRTLCIMLVIQCVASYRSVPKIINLFNEKADLELPWIPHFTSVINWTLRLGLGQFNQVGEIAEKWLAIVDYSIDVGTKKALVVLRVRMDALAKRGQALCLEDCECIGLTVRDSVNGETIAADLAAIFEKSGKPVAIIKDCDYTLAKGVRDWGDTPEANYPVIDDIGHVAASALRAQYEESECYQTFTHALTTLANRIRQTCIAFLLPPKLRTKGRFQSISTVAKWAEKVLNLFEGYQQKTEKTAEEKKIWDKFTQAIPNLAVLKPFIQSFAQTTLHVSNMLEILKNNGLNHRTAQQCQQILEQLPADNLVRIRLQAWLDKTLLIYQKYSQYTLPVSSDIVESLFGNFKNIIARSPQADMNRSVLLIPALCGNLCEQNIIHAFAHASQNDLIEWEKKHIPYTIRGERRTFFDSQKMGNTSATG